MAFAMNSERRWESVKYSCVCTFSVVNFVVDVLVHWNWNFDGVRLWHWNRNVFFYSDWVRLFDRVRNRFFYWNFNCFVNWNWYGLWNGNMNRVGLWNRNWNWMWHCNRYWVWKWNSHVFDNWNSYWFADFHVLCNWNGHSTTFDSTSEAAATAVAASVASAVASAISATEASFISRWLVVVEATFVLVVRLGVIAKNGNGQGESDKNELKNKSGKIGIACSGTASNDLKYFWVSHQRMIFMLISHVTKNL